MFDKITFQFAINAMLTILSLVIVFHILVYLQVLPYNIVWGGRLNSVEEMKRSEPISIIINIFLILVISIKGGYLKVNVSSKIIDIILWLFVVMFSLNTLGNLFAVTLFEKLVYTPLTLISAILCFIMVKKLN